VPLRNNRRQHRRQAGFAAAIVAIAIGASMVGPRAALAFFPIPENNPGYIVLDVRPEELYYPDLEPGETVYGQVRVTLRDAVEANLAMSIFVGGPIFQQSDGLMMVTTLCEDEWVDVPYGIIADRAPTCPRGERILTSQMAPLPAEGSSQSADIGLIDGDNNQYLLLRLSMPPNTTGRPMTPLGLEGEFSLRVDATGEDIVSASTDPRLGALPHTGVEILGGGIIAMGAIMLGVLVRRGRRQTNEMD
jgi:hypothetical protein